MRLPPLPTPSHETNDGNGLDGFWRGPMRGTEYRRAGLVQCAGTLYISASSAEAVIQQDGRGGEARSWKRCDPISRARS